MLIFVTKILIKMHLLNYKELKFSLYEDRIDKWECDGDGIIVSLCFLNHSIFEANVPLGI